MKKIYLLALLSTCLSLSIFANGVEIDGIYYLLDSTNYTASVTYIGSSTYDNNGYTGEVVVPSSVNYNSQVYNVTSIGNSAFSSCSGLTSIEIPNSVTSIGADAFYGCTSLTSVTIPNSVISIGKYAFGFGLTAVHISDLTAWCEIVIDTMMSNPLYYAHNLYLNGELVTDLVIPNDVSIIKEYAFVGGGFSSVTIPSSVTSIEQYAFFESTDLTSVTIGNSVTSIGMAAFSNCSGLTSVTIPNSVTSIGADAFSNCSGLTSVTIPNSVTSIGSYAFIDCDGLPVIENLRYADTYLVEAVDESLSTCNIRQGTKWIGESAFSSCRSLTSVTIPTSVTSIGTYAFWNCSNLTSVYCEAVEPPSLGYNPFYDISHTAVLHVPYESIDAYKAISGYADYFAEIKGFSDVEDITKSTATLKWIPDSAVTQYDINVYTGGIHFAQYLVDGNGQIISSQRFAPSIYHHKLDTTTSSTDYFVITLDGLSAETNYTYTIDGTNAQSAPIYHEEGSFTTLNDNEEGFLDAIPNEERKPRKILRNGQIYILRGEKVYNAQGALVK